MKLNIVVGKAVGITYTDNEERGIEIRQTLLAVILRRPVVLSEKDTKELLGRKEDLKCRK